MNNLRRDFLNQSIETLENLTLRLQDETNGEVFSENFRREAFRALHTIKGTAQTFGFPVSGKLAHELENFLSTDEDRQISADENRKSVFLEGLRLLKKTFEQKDFEIPASFAEKIRAVAPTANDSETFLSQIPAPIFSQLSSREKNVVNSALRAGKNLFCVEIGFDLTNFADGLTDFREVLSEKCEIVATLPGAKFNLQGKIGFQILAASAESGENIERIAEKYSAEIIFQTAPRNFSNDLRGVLEQSIAHGENLAKQLGKGIDFEISDKITIDEIKISPPFLKTVFEVLLHLVRNAIDHGIETPTQRTAQNKVVCGQIKIQFSSDADNFYVKITDDGRGLDTEKIKAKAIEKNLIGAGENLSDEALHDLIFAPEFSTAERLTEISGRGVGLDAVKAAVEKIGRKINVESRKENGTTFEYFCRKKNKTQTNANLTGFSNIYFGNLSAFVSASFLVLFAFSFAGAQNLPKEIRGYKVYDAKISVKNQNETPETKAVSQIKDESEAFVKVGEPEIVNVSLAGITFEITAEIDNIKQSGTVDFISFKDFLVNDLAVNVEEYKESFSFTKNQKIVLPKPVKFFLGAGETLRGVLKEINRADDEWTVSGTVFVFGRFKKFGFNFKRVVPIEVNLKIKNPLKQVQSSRLKVQI